MLHNGKGGGGRKFKGLQFTHMLWNYQKYANVPLPGKHQIISPTPPRTSRQTFIPPPRIFSGFAHVIAGWDFHVKSWCVILTIWSWSNLETLLHIKTDLWDSSLRHNIATVLIFLNLLLAQFHIQDVKTFRWI